MDRVTVRSFRGSDLAERGLKELARSRLDTTRAVAFQPLGNRFLDAREDPARIAQLLREDAFHAEEGHFTRMVLRLPPHISEKLAGLEPRLVERRIEEATRDALRRELPRAQGVYLARFEPAARGGLEPVVHVQLSSRQVDGGPAPALTREDARRFEGTWSREVEKGFGISRVLAREMAERQENRDRDTAPKADLGRLRQEWARASARLFALYSGRLAGKVTERDLAEAAELARAARTAWTRHSGSLVDLRDVARRQLFDVVRVRIEGGSRYLQGPLEPRRREVLELAATRAVRLPETLERRLTAVAWPAGPDLHATVYFNPRDRAERTPESLEPERLQAALESSLRDEIHRAAAAIDPAAAARNHELGRVAAWLPESAPGRALPAPSRGARADSQGREAAAAFLVALDREFSRRIDGGGRDRDDRAAILERLEPSQREWNRERVVVVGLRIPTGAEQLDRAGLSAEETARVVQRAVDRAYPFLEREGIRDGAIWSRHDRALDVQVLVPERLGWTPNQLRSPQFQQRFITGFHREITNVGRTRIGPTREPLMPSAVRRIATAGQVPQLIRQAEQDPERAAQQLARAVFDKLSAALPKPFRVMRELSRAMSRFVPRGE